MAIDPVTGAVMSNRATVEGWLDGLLMDGLMISEEHDQEAREFRYEAARALVEELAPAEGGGGVAERIIAVHFAAAQAAALEWQGRAVSRYLPEKSRESAQRFANALYTIVKGQAATLSRLAETRRKAATETRREARDLELRREIAEHEAARAVPPPAGLAELLTPGPRRNGEAESPSASALGSGAFDPAADPDLAAAAGLAPGTDLASLPRQQRRAALRRLKKLAKQNGPGA